MTTALARSIAACLLRRSEDAVVTICAGRSGQAHARFSGQDLHRAALARSEQLLSAFEPAAGPLAIVMRTGADFVISLIGALYAGFTVVPMAPPRPGPQIERFNFILGDCRAAAILCSEDLAPRLQQAQFANLDGRDIPIVSTTRFELDVPAATVGALPSGGGGADRPAIIQYTSGSTRSPRGVLLNAETILANGALANRTWGMDERGIMLNWLPHFHDMGLMGGILYPILSGGVTALMDPLHMIQRPERWLQLIGELRATFSGGPAFAFAHCLNTVRDDQCENLDLSSWQKAFCGAEPVPSALMDAFRVRFAPHGLNPRAVFASYGLAEYTLMVAGGTHDLSESRSRPRGCEGIEPCRVANEMRDLLRIVDPETRRPVPEGTVGEVWLRGASVASGYLGHADESESVFGAKLDDLGGPRAPGGTWLRSGDLAILRDGFLYVTGRLKDVLFANGQKIPASAIEWLAARQDPALNPMAAAAVMADEMQSGTGVLLIELRRRSVKIEDEEALRRAIRRVVGGAWSIDLTEIRFLAPNTLPRTTSGKVQRRLAAQAFRDSLFCGALAA